jgi:hypothetical protein
MNPDATDNIPGSPQRPSATMLSGRRRNGRRASGGCVAPDFPVVKVCCGATACCPLTHGGVRG